MSSRVASSAISPSGQSRCWDSNNQFICIAQWSNLGCRIYLRKLSIRPISKSPFPIPPLAEMKKILHRFSLSLFIQVALFSTDRKMALRRHWTYWKLKRQMCWSITADVDFTMCKKRLNSCSQIRELFKDDF